MIKKIGNPEIFNKELISKINKAEIDLYYIKNKSDFRDKILNKINSNDSILDIGKGMRDKFSKIKSNKVETLDVNEYEDYPDIIFDLCDRLDESLHEKYDKIICLAILEHVYNPFSAVDNLKKMLKKMELFLVMYHI